MEMRSLGERLKIARKYANLSQEELGEKAKCGQGVVSKIERGDQEKSAYVVQLAVACGVRPEWLAMEQGNMVDDPKYSVSTPEGVAEIVKAWDMKSKYELIQLTLSLVISPSQQAPADRVCDTQESEPQPIESQAERRLATEARRKIDLGFDPERRHLYGAPNFTQKKQTSTDRRRKKT